MVSFTRIPYAEAARRARRQDLILYAGLTAVASLFLALLLGMVRALTG
jgi:hypothetical protein